MKTAPQGAEACQADTRQGEGEGFRDVRRVATGNFDLKFFDLKFFENQLLELLESGCRPHKLFSAVSAQKKPIAPDDGQIDEVRTVVVVLAEIYLKTAEIVLAD